MVSVVRKFIKEEQRVTPTWGSRLTTKKVFKDIVKAADDFSSRVGSGQGVDKDNIHKGKGKGDSTKEKHRRSKARAREIPRVIPREKVESPQSQTKNEKGFKKRGISRQDRGEEYRPRWKEEHRKMWFDRKNNGDKNGGKAKKGRK